MNNFFIESQDDYKLQGKINFNGLIIDIENKKGSIRKGKDPDGKEWSIKMNADYGRIRNTKTKSDKEEVDVYVLSNKNAKYVYQIKQMKAPKFEEFDEFKYILGASTPSEAIELYLKQYNDAGFFGDVKEIPFDEFKEKIDEYISRNKVNPEVNEIFNKWKHMF